METGGVRSVGDSQNVANEKILQASINGKQVLLSTLVYTKTFLVFTKAKLLILTEDKVIIANSKSKQMRFVNRYTDLQGVTKSLRIGATNFIVHFGQRAEEEWFCPERDQIIEIIDTQYRQLKGEPFKLYGLSSATLDDYCTSERDLARRISRVPPPDFLITKKAAGMNQSAITEPQEAATTDDWDDWDELVDDFVILEQPSFDKYNQEDRLLKEKETKNTGDSMMLIGKPGLKGEVVTLEDFEIRKVIDKGSFGKVFLVYNRKMGRQYAMKRINKDLLLQKKQVQNIKNEKDILFQADHPFVNSMDFVFQNELRIYFFLKFLPGGNIYDNIYKMKRFQEPTVKFIGAQLVLAMGYLHEKGIVHRDLKPENVLMDSDGYVSLADFGLAKFLQTDAQTYSFCGTAEYLAPEILNMTGHGFSVDWWTLGILMYEMATGRPPFLNKSHHKLGLLIRTGKIVFPDPVKHKIFMSDDLKDLIMRLLDRNTETRLGTNGDAQEIMAHPFFAGVNWEALLKREIPAEYVPDVSEDTGAVEESKGDESSKLLNPYEAGGGAAAASTSSHALGHSIIDEDKKDELSAAQKELVRQNQDKFSNF